MPVERSLFGTLIVDDEPYVREGLKGLIDWGSYGFTICGEAPNGQIALDMMREIRPRLVITDIRMPEMDGLELIRMAVCVLKLDCRFIILSGYDDFRYAQTAMKYNVRNYLLKPIEEDELAKALSELRGEIEDGIAGDRERALSLKARGNETVRRLMQGETGTDVAAFAAKYLHACSGAPMSLAMVEIMDIRQWLSEMDYEEIQSNLADIHKNIANAVGPGNELNIALEEPHRFYILVTPAILDNWQADESSFCRALCGSVAAGGRYRIAVYAGKRVTGLAGVRESYESCVLARELNFFERKSGVLLYDELKDRTFSYNITGDIGYAGLLGAVESFRKNSMPEAVEEFFSDLQKRLLAPDMVRACAAGFQLEVLRLIADKNGDPEKLTTRFTMKELELQTSEELKKNLLDFCLASADYIGSLRELHTPVLMAEVEKYVRRNFRSELNLKGVAERFFINPVYLGQLFRKSFGVYFNDYLHGLRIEEAVKLLKNSDMKVHEIAERIGYSDPDYFIRKFKKLLGVSPSLYRCV